jgi:PilC-like protein with beta-propeller domain/Calx-beta domain-containing protein
MKFTGMGRKFGVWLFMFIFAAIMAPALGFATNYELKVDPVSVTEQDVDTTLTFAVTLTPAIGAGSPDEVTVSYYTGNDTAINSSDFTGVSGTINFRDAVGQRDSQTVAITVKGDDIVESDETFYFRLTGEDVTNPGPNTVTIGADTGTGTITNDDSYEATIEAGPKDGAEDGAGSLSYTVTLSNEVSEDVDVTYTVIGSGPNPAAGTDFSPSGGIVTVNAGDTEGFIVVDLIDDTLVEVDEEFTITLTGASGGKAGGLGAAITATGTITNDDSYEVRIETGVKTGAEGGSQVYNVTLSNPVAWDIDVAYSIAGSDAGVVGTDPAEDTANEDYTVSSPITISAGLTTGAIAVNFSDDFIVEPDEGLTLTLTGVSPGTSASIDAANDQGAGIIINDDVPVLTVSDNVTVVEGDPIDDRAATFTVSTSLAVHADTSIPFDWVVDHGLTQADDFTVLSGNSSISGGTGAGGSVSIAATVKGDILVESDEDYGIALQNGQILGTATTPDFSDKGSGTIENNDAYEVTIEAGPKDGAEDGAGSLSYTVTLSNEVTEDVDVTYTVIGSGPNPAAGTDFSSSGGMVTINAGDTEGFIVVDLVDDTLVEVDEEFTITLTGASGGKAGGLGAAITATGTITNDDSYEVRIETGVKTGAEGGSQVYNVTLSNPVAWDIDVAYSIAGSDAGVVGTDPAEDTANEDYTVSSPITISAGLTTGAIAVNFSDDFIVEPDEGLTLTLTGVSPGTSASIDAANDQGAGIIINDDVPVLTVSDNVTVVEGDPIDDRAATFTVSTSLAVHADTSIPFDWVVDHGLTQADDFTVLSGNSSISGGTGAGGSVSIAATVKGDILVESDEDYGIALQNGQILGTATTPDFSDKGSGTIENNDAPTLSITLAASSDNEGDSGQKTVNYTVESDLEVASNASVIFDFTVANTTAEPDDLVTGTFSGTIDGGKIITVPVLIIGDKVVEGDEEYTVGLGTVQVQGSGVVAPVNPALVTSTIENDDILTLSVNDSSIHEGQALTTDPGFIVTTDQAVASDTTVSFDWAVQHGTTEDADFATGPPVSGSLSFSGVAAGGTVAVPLAIATDSEDEPDEKYTLEFSNGAISNTSDKPDISDIGSGKIKNDDHTFVISKTLEPASGQLSTDYSGTHVADDSFTVSRGDDITFTMESTNACYHIEDYQVDGVSEGDLASYTNQPPMDYNDYTSDSYTFTSVEESHAVNLDMAINTYTIATKQYGGDGTITPTAEFTCWSDTPTITATAGSGSYITWFKVDGVKVSSAYGQSSFDYTLPGVLTPGKVREDYLIEVAFAFKATMLHESPFGTVEITVYNSDEYSGIADGTVLIPNEDGDIYVDSEAELRFETIGENHIVQGPDYIDAPEQLDNRVHQHHLSKITDNSSESSAFCGTGFADPNYRSDSTCLYTIASMEENHEIEILFTGFIDVSAHGFGDIKSTPELNVDATVSGSAIGSLEFEAGEERALVFNPVEGWFVQSLKYKVTPEDKADEPGLTSISRAISYIIPADLDLDHGLQVNFAINTFTIVATSTFEELLFNNVDLQDDHKISVDNGNTVTQVDYNTDQHYYVVLNDPDFSVVGVSIDNTLIPINSIRNYADGSETNPNSTTYTFSISTISGNEILNIAFTSVKVSHHLEVRDYDNVIIADVPLDAQANPNPPALMFVTDDSGSMDWEFMVEEGADWPDSTNTGGTYRYYYYLWNSTFVPSNSGWPNYYNIRSYSSTPLQNNNRHDEWKTQWSGYNKMYYNPTATYSPWPTYKGGIDHDQDNDPNDEVLSKLPGAIDAIGDNQAHANMYRPRHHPWYTEDCSNALTKADLKRNGDAAASGVDLSGCSNNQTFAMDGTFLSLGTEHEIIVDNSDAAFSSSATGWAPYSTYIYTDSSDTAIRTAEWTFSPDLSTSWKVYARWLSNSSRKTISYDLECSTCATPVNDTVMKNQNDGQSSTYWRYLGEYDLDDAQPFTVTLTDTNNQRSSSAADAIKIVSYSGLDIINAHYITFDDQNGNNERDELEDFWVVNLTDPIQYIEILDHESPNAATPEISATNLGPVYEGSTLPAGLELVTYADPTDPNAFVLERQNFSDWYSYYRTRMLAATSAIALAVERMSNVEVGIHTINSRYYGIGNSSNYGITQSVLPVRVWGKRDKTKYLHYLLYTFKQGGKGTPLRSGHAKVARYFDATDCNAGYGYLTSSSSVHDSTGQSELTKPADSSCDADEGDERDYLSPFAKDSTGEEKNGDRCKVAIAVLVTDGYWNSDGSAGSEVGNDYLLSGHPEKLRSIWDNTLAKTAYDYRFKKDLMNDSESDDQFMVTYGVAFGLNGSLAYDEDLKCSVADASQCPTWPYPSDGQPTTIDDLWHASVVGEGKYLNADSPVALVKALGSIVSDIAGKKGSSASLAINGDEVLGQVGEEVRMYQASWNTDDWSGDLKSYDPNNCGEILDEDGKPDGLIDLSTCEKWSARYTLENRSDARIIASYDPWKNGGNGEGIAFKYDSLDELQKSRLFPYFASDIADPAKNVVNLLRGDVTLDAAAVQRLRTLPALGDIVDSRGRYQRYEKADGTSTGVVFVGANDGMLHAFSAEDTDQGKELFAYVPGLVYRNLRELADPEYEGANHKMFVNGTQYTETISYDHDGDSNTDKIEKTFLVGGLGKGGKGYYALDVTNAHNTITNEGELAGRVLWEYPPAPDKLVVNKKVTFTASRILFDTPLSSAEQTLFNKYTHFEIIGANSASGVLISTNDGIYAIDDGDNDGVPDGVATDGTSVQIPTAAFDTMTDVNVTMIGSISDRDMGYSFGKPMIVRTNDSSVGFYGWVVIFGNGFGSENGDSVLYVLHPESGDVITKLYTTRDGVHGGGFSGMATPKVIDVDNDLRADYVYGGDLLGNMWKFDLTDPTYSNWQVAFCDGSSVANASDCVRTDDGLALATPGVMVPQPLFKTNLKQPITSAPDVMRHESGLGYMVIFGTGKYLGWLDLVTTDPQSLYGIWDWAPDTFDEGYHGARADNYDTSVPPNLYVELTNYPQKGGLGAPLRSLLKQDIVVEGFLSEDVNNNGTLDPGEDINNDGVLQPAEDLDGDGFLDLGEDINENGEIDEFKYFRIPTAYPFDFRTVLNSTLGGAGYGDYVELNGPADMRVPLVHLGWVSDLPGKLTLGTGRDLDGNDTGRTYNIDPTLEHTAENYELGERQVNDTLIRDGKAIMITFGLSGDKCGASAYSFLNERNVNSGGMLFLPNYDINRDSYLKWDDVVAINPDGSRSYLGIATDRMDDGRLQNPIFKGDKPPEDGTETKYLSGSALGQGLNGARIKKIQESAPRSGVYYWNLVQ